MVLQVEFVGVDQLTLSGLTIPLTLQLGKPLTDLELMAFSRHVRPYPVERNSDGSLTIGQAISCTLGQLQMEAASELWKWSEGHGGQAFSSSVGYVWTDTSARMASASWITDARRRKLKGAKSDAFIPGSPDFLINILYDATQRSAIETRMQDWMSNGAQLAWMIDPFAAEVLVYQQGVNTACSARPDWVEADTVVTGFRLDTSNMWDREE